MKRVNKGENVLLKRNLKKVDGTDLLISEVSSISVDVMQRGIIVESYTYPSTFLYQGENDHQVILEISTTISNSFIHGEVIASWTILAGNLDFEGEGIQKDIIEEKILFIK